MSEVSSKKVVVKIGDKEISLSLDEAKELQDILNRTFGAEKTVGRNWQKAALDAENERLQDCYLRHGRIQPDGELGVSVSDVVAENANLRFTLGLIVDVCKSFAPLAASATVRCLAQAALDAAGGE